MVKKFPKALFKLSTPETSKRLLGCFLECSTPEGKTLGRIVETEAYLSKDDPACHASRGRTKRNDAMFGQPGTAYIYFIYGMYYCFNIVTQREGIGEAVLVRAVEPLRGLKLMAQRRQRPDGTHLCDGPGKLTIALGMLPAHNGTSLETGPIRLYSADSFPKDFPPAKQQRVVTTTRVGITSAVDLPLRFYLEGSEFISRK
jgi:DNA-3-methyladenine glycosylase